jgi:hypothetical protein
MLARPFEITGRLDATSQQGLREFARLPASTSILGNREVLDKILKDLFTAVAAGLPGR